VARVATQRGQQLENAHERPSLPHPPSPYRHTPLFPLGKDSTTYRKLSADGLRVETVQIGGKAPLYAGGAARLSGGCLFRHQSSAAAGAEGRILALTTHRPSG
jgi:hypothetical protein